MNRMTRIAVAALATLFLTSGVASAQQSLAEFARRERERRGPGPEAPVITNEMLSLRLPNPVTGTAPQKPPQNAATTAKTDDKKDDKAEAPKTRDEAWWRKAFADARENVSRAEAQVKVLELQVNDAKTDLLIRNDIFNKEGQLIPRINTLTVDLETAQRRAQEARQKVVDLEDDLRKSGGLPAWAR